MSELSLPGLPGDLPPGMPAAVADQLATLRQQASSSSLAAPKVEDQVVPAIPMASEPMPQTLHLPSCGRVYSHAVSIRQMVTKEIKMLSMLKDGASYERILTDILNNCIKSGPKAEKLFFHDRTYLLLWLRINSFRQGHLYQPQIECPACEHEFEPAIDLRKLTITDLSPDYKEPLEIGLVDSPEIRLGIRMLRGEDEDAVDRYMKANPKLKREDHEWFVRYANAIVLVNGFSYDLDDKVKMLQSLSADDFMLLRQFPEKFLFGVSFDIEVQCENKECARLLKMDLPFQRSFFIPENKSP